MFSKRRFGVEIETINISREKIQKVFNSVKTKNEWRIHEDGSIQPYGWEIVSPPLSGIDGLKETKRMVKALQKAGAKANSTCGLHVHVDAKNLQSIDLANIVLRYAKFENKIDSLMPDGRRYNENDYCLSVQDIANDIAKAKFDNISWLEPEGFVEKFIEDYNRFHKVNLLSYFDHGTVEFRHHFGTVDEENINNWIQFCLNFVEKSKISKNNIKSKKIPSDVKDLILVFGEVDNEMSKEDIGEEFGIKLIDKAKKFGFNIVYNKKRESYQLVSKPNLCGIKEFPKLRGDKFTDGLNKKIISFYSKKPKIPNDYFYGNKW